MDFSLSRGDTNSAAYPFFLSKRGYEKGRPIRKRPTFQTRRSDKLLSAPWLKTTASGTPARAPEKIGPGRLMGFKRRRVELEQSDARETDALDSTADLSLNYELELANFAAIPDDDQQPEEEDRLPEPEEPSPANLDLSDLFAYVLLQSSSSART